jgi:MGT family glycosyltransferase
MARYIIVTYPLAGHMTPNLMIVKRLIEHGHEVLWIAGRIFESKVKAIGALYRPLPKEIDFGDRQIYDVFPQLKKLKGLAQSNYYVKKVFFGTVLPTIKAIDSALEEFSADVLIGDSIMPGVFLKSEMTGIPSVMVSTFSLGILSKDTAPFGMGIAPGKTVTAKARDRVLNFLMQYVLLKNLDSFTNNLRENLGLTRFRKPVFRAYFEIPTIKRILQLSTPSFEYPQSDRPETYQFIGPVLPEAIQDYALPRWWPELNTSKPVVLINQGTVSTNINDLIIPAINGLKHEDMLVVAAPVGNDVLGTLPNNVRAEAYIPHSNIMPYVDVMISNGGHGSTQMALAHGVPMVIAGATEEKMEVAARVAWSGCGINIRKKSPTPQDFLNAIKKVLGNKQFAQNARRLQMEIRRYDSPAAAVRLMEHVAIQHQDDNRFNQQRSAA